MHGKKLSMKLKNKLLLLSLSLIIILSLTSCRNKNSKFIDEEVNPQINAFSVKLNMEESKVLDILGSKGEKANCVYGYEYEYTDKKINVGFDSNSNMVRRVTIKNPDNSIYGINAGVMLEDAYNIIEQNGFEKTENKYKFIKENIILSIISMKGTNADGVIIEINPN